MQAKKLHLMQPWQEVKEKIKEIVPFLTDEDLELEEGKEEEMLQHLADKMENDKDSVKKWIESVSANQGKAG